MTAAEEGPPSVHFDWLSLQIEAFAFTSGFLRTAEHWEQSVKLPGEQVEGRTQWHFIQLYTAATFNYNHYSSMLVMGINNTNNNITEPIYGQQLKNI